jgi:hypothetical protein
MGECWRDRLLAYLTLVVKPSLLFVASDLLYPDRGEGGMLDLRAHFFKVRRPFFVVGLIFPFADMADSLLKGWQHVQDLGWPYFGSMLGAIAAGTAGVLSANERLHAALVVFVLVIMIGGMVSALAYVQ